MKKLIILLLGIYLLSSCDDFTTITPISEVTVESSFNTASDFELAVNGAYQALQLTGNYGLNYIMVQEMRADNSFNGGGPTGLAESIEEIDVFGVLPRNGNIENVWRDSYNGINRTNAILDNIEDADFDPDLRDIIKGEALFLRSLYYYHLALTFGNIPLRLQVTRTPSEQINQVPASEVFNQVIGDLDQARQLLPQQFTDQEDIGRATSGAANTLLAKIHLITGNNQAAEDALRRVINSNQYRLLDDFSNLWGAENENNAESIFEVQFKSGGTGTGSAYVDMFTDTPAGVGGGNAPQGVTESIEEAFETGDLREAATIFEEPAQLSVTKYQGETFTELDSDLNFMVFRFADVLLMLAEAIGESDEAYQLINQVRERAGLDEIGPTTPGTFDEKLLQERRVELAFENHRWYDLKRFNVAKQVMADHLNMPESEINLLFPIPQREIDVSNGELIQNPEFTDL
mgnify:CR=1 FL=1